MRYYSADALDFLKTGAFYLHVVHNYLAYIERGNYDINTLQVSLNIICRGHLMATSALENIRASDLEHGVTDVWL